MLVAESINQSQLVNFVHNVYAMAKEAIVSIYIYVSDNVSDLYILINGNEIFLKS